MGIDSWVKKHRSMKCARAWQTINLSDSRWSKRVLTWSPCTNSQSFRRVGRPRRRWTDGFEEAAATIGSTDWTTLPRDFLES
eukprot:11583858-Karenia_brevis.AAC.1